MNEFQLIQAFFKSHARARADVLCGIGDDAACLSVPVGHHLLVSCDTLVSGVHFLPTWDAYDIASKAVMVNISDMAAMGAEPAWALLALTMPALDSTWLTRFAEGLHQALSRFNVALVGGDTTRGPLCMTLTMQGFVPEGQAVMRHGAQIGDIIYVSGSLGAAAMALASLTRYELPDNDRDILMQHLHCPTPRVDLSWILQTYAHAAIDVSDGLMADLQHVCDASGVGACVDLQKIPIHALVQRHDPMHALDHALYGGDDYEICFTVPPAKDAAFRQHLAQHDVPPCYAIGHMEATRGLRAKTRTGEIVPCQVKGYQHF